MLSTYDDGLLAQLIVDLVGGALMVGLALLIAWDKAKARADRLPAPAAVAAAR